MVCLYILAPRHKEPALPQTVPEMITELIKRQTAIESDLKFLVRITLESARRDDGTSGYLWSALDDALADSKSILHDLGQAEQEAKGAGQ